MSKTLKILSRPSGNAEEYGRWSVNAFVGCPHGCTYCYLKKGVWAKNLGGNTPKLKKGVLNDEHAYHLAMTEIIENREEILKDGGLFMSFTSDPCAEETRDLMFLIASGGMHNHIPVTILTKASGFFCPTIQGFSEKYRSLPDEPARLRYGNSVHAFLKWLSDDALSPEYMKSHIAFGWTLTGHDELEPNASPNADRVAAMKEMAGYGMKVWASIEPVIDFPSSLDMVQQAVNAGCQHFKIGLLTSNTRVCRDKYDVNDCLHFVEDVMRLTEGKATVYWKQSVRDLIGSEHEWQLDIDLHSVGKDWSMFNIEEKYADETQEGGLADEQE